MSKVHHTSCPVCGSEDIHPLLTVKDHSVSGEDFVVWQCGSCSLQFTQDAPGEDSIAPYYQSADYISHTNTDRGLINRLYQKIRKRTLDQKAALVMSKTVPRGRILDLGAGIGAFLNTMKEKQWEIAGVEPDAGARQQARHLFGIDLEQTAALNQFTAASFDAISLWHVLEHVHQLHAYIERLKTLLKPEGKLFIAVPNYQSLDHSIYKL
jgi:2-polyprenyl-3-methyl-5-hydroxy-6-metoxy-1,4-benzoquinol methylase